MPKFTTVILMLTMAFGTTIFAGCGSDAPSASEWSAKVIDVCTRLISERQAAAESLPTDEAEAPTVEQVMAFYADFAPKFAEAAHEIEALDRPDGLDAKIDEFLAALDGATKAVRRSVSDRAAVEAEIAAGPEGQTKEMQRLEIAAAAVGLAKCNG